MQAGSFGKVKWPECVRLPLHRFAPVSAGTSGETRLLDAIFVPTQRLAPAIGRSLAMLTDVAREVWLLPSGPALDGELLKSLPSRVRCFEPDLIHAAQDWFLRLQSSQNPSLAVSRDYDLPIKRNLALQTARNRGFERVCLLDDDIDLSAGQIGVAAAALTPTSPIVGFYVHEYPDVSAIEHVSRLLNDEPAHTLPGGNCLFLMPAHVVGYFPYVYNEDWLFVLHNVRNTRGIVVGEACQEAHTPWTDLQRIRFEQFGETFVSGVLMSDGLMDSTLTSESFWSALADARASWLARLLAQARGSVFETAVETALEMSESISGQDCVRFAAALQGGFDRREGLCIPY